MSTNRKPTTKSYSISKVLRKENKSDDKLEMMLSNLSLEEIIALKLEISSRSVGNRLYGGDEISGSKAGRLWKINEKI